MIVGIVIPYNLSTGKIATRRDKIPVPRKAHLIIEPWGTTKYRENHLKRLIRSSDEYIYILLSTEMADVLLTEEVEPEFVLAEVQANGRRKWVQMTMDEFEDILDANTWLW